MNSTRQYKMMIVASILVPVACHANELQEPELRISQLENERWKIEDELDQLRDKLTQEASKYGEHKDAASVHWKTSNDDEDKEAAFESFLDELVRTLYVGGNVEAIFARTPWMNAPGIRVMVLSAAFKALCVNRTCNEYDELVREFIKISSQLNQLR